MKRAEKLCDLEEAKSNAHAERLLDAMEDSFKMKDGNSIKLRYRSSHFKQEYKDEYTGEILPRHLVRAAMIDELKWFNDTVWEGIEASSQRMKELMPIRTCGCSVTKATP